MRGGLVASTLILALTLVACDASEPLLTPDWTLTFPAGNDVAALPVTVSDRVGVVVGAQIDPGFASWQAGPHEVAGEPNALAIGWLGGMCDREVSIVVSNGSAWTVDVATRSDDHCRLGGLTRGVILVLRAPMDLSLLDMNLNGVRVRP